MPKKQNNKKKISLKLTLGETAIVLDYETAMHIAETYDYLANQQNDDYSDWFRQVADIIRAQSVENYFDSEDDDYEEW